MAPRTDHRRPVMTDTDTDTDTVNPTR